MDKYKSRRYSITSEVLAPSSGDPARRQDAIALRPDTASSSSASASAPAGTASPEARTFYTKSRRSSFTAAAAGLMGTGVPPTGLLPSTGGPPALAPEAHHASASTVARVVHGGLGPFAKHDTIPGSKVPGLAVAASELMAPAGLARRHVLEGSPGRPTPVANHAPAFVAGSPAGSKASLPSVPPAVAAAAAAAMLTAKPSHSSSGWGASLAGFGSPAAKPAPAPQRRSSVSDASGPASTSAVKPSPQSTKVQQQAPQQPSPQRLQQRRGSASDAPVPAAITAPVATSPAAVSLQQQRRSSAPDPSVVAAAAVATVQGVASPTRHLPPADRVPIAAASPLSQQIAAPSATVQPPLDAARHDAAGAVPAVAASELELPGTVSVAKDSLPTAAVVFQHGQRLLADTLEHSAPTSAARGTSAAVSAPTLHDPPATAAHSGATVEAPPALPGIITQDDAAPRVPSPQAEAEPRVVHGETAHETERVRAGHASKPSHTEHPSKPSEELPSAAVLAAPLHAADCGASVASSATLDSGGTAGFEAPPHQLASKTAAGKASARAVATATPAALDTSGATVSAPEIPVSPPRTQSRIAAAGADAVPSPSGQSPEREALGGQAAQGGRRLSASGRVMAPPSNLPAAGVSSGRARLRSSVSGSPAGVEAAAAASVDSLKAVASSAAARSSPSHCACGRRTTGAGRAFVLDTDVGWDPDAALALCAMARAACLSGSPLAVLSSSEVANAPRALAARWILRRLGIPDVDVLVAAGERPAENEPFSPSMRRAIAKDPGAPAAIGSLKDVSAFIAAQQAAGRAVSWVGTSAMTNLAALLAAHEAAPAVAPRPDRVVQQGTCLDGVATNMRLDPRAAHAALGALERLGIPLTLITSDTTRWGLCWQEEGPEYESSPLAAQLYAAWSKDAAVTDVIQAATRRRHGGYIYASSLHAPLAALTALDSCCEGAPPYVPAAPARVSLDAAGRATVRIVGNAVNERAAAVKALGGELCSAQAFWEGQDPAPSRELFGLLRSPGGGLPNCVLSLGPLTPAEVDTFVARLLGALLPTAAAAAKKAAAAVARSLSLGV